MVKLIRIQSFTGNCILTIKKCFQKYPISKLVSIESKIFLRLKPSTVLQVSQSRPLSKSSITQVAPSVDSNGLNKKLWKTCKNLNLDHCSFIYLNTELYSAKFFFVFN